MPHQRVLVVDDDETIQVAIAASLPEGVAATAALTSADAREKLESMVFDLVILDLSLPDGDGMRLCSWIRSQDHYSEVAVVLLTGSPSVDDKVMAFSLGADDYLMKPFETREFRARIQAKLKKTARKAESRQTFSRGNIRFDISAQRVYIAEQIEPVEMTPIEFRLLLFFAQNEDRVFSRDILLTKIWGENVHVADRTVDSHISDLRQKLKVASHTVKAVRGVGYQFCSHQKNMMP